MVNYGMRQILRPNLLNTLRFAMALKFLGVVIALTIGRFTIHQTILDRWWFSVLSTTLLLLWLTPWPNLAKPEKTARLQETQLRSALLLAIISPFLEIIPPAYIPLEPLLANPLYVSRFNWTAEQALGIHTLGLIFVIVPIVLAGWGYSWPGLTISLSLSGLCYVTLPLLLPSNALTWGIYAVRGFVLLGTALIAGYVVTLLAENERQEQAALAAANARLTHQSSILEELAINQERNRLSRELHDTLAHSLSAASIQLQAVDTLVDRQATAAREALAEAQQTVRVGLEESRRAIKALRSSPLKEYGLSGAIRQLTAQLALRSGLHLQLEIDEPWPRCRPAADQALYRIVEELLHNAERHAAATALKLSLRWDNERAQLTVICQDDGRGFDQAIALSSGRLGLVGIFERVELLRGRVEIDSAPGNGTKIEISIPKSMVLEV